MGRGGEEDAESSFQNPEHVYAQVGCIGSEREETSWFPWDIWLFQQPVVIQCLTIPCLSPISLT